MACVFMLFYVISLFNLPLIKLCKIYLNQPSKVIDVTSVVVVFSCLFYFAEDRHLSVTGQETSPAFCVNYAFYYCAAIDYPNRMYLHKYPNVSFALCPKLCWR